MVTTELENKDRTKNANMAAGALTRFPQTAAMRHNDFPLKTQAVSSSTRS
jgi:hypothetical protein